MRIDFIILADSAQAVGNKIYLLGGGWTVFRSPSFPANAMMGVGVGLSMRPEDVGQTREVELSIKHEGGEVIAEITLGIAAGPTEVPGTEPKALLALNGPIPIPKAGRYTITVKAGDTQSEIAFHAVAAAPVVSVLTSAGEPQR